MVVLVTLPDALLLKTGIDILRVRNIKIKRPLKYQGGTIKCSTITHSAIETRQQKEQWVGGWDWVFIKWGGGGGVRTRLPTMFLS